MDLPGPYRYRSVAELCLRPQTLEPLEVASSGAAAPSQGCDSPRGDLGDGLAQGE